MLPESVLGQLLQHRKPKAADFMGSWLLRVLCVIPNQHQKQQRLRPGSVGTFSPVAAHTACPRPMLQFIVDFRYPSTSVGPVASHRAKWTHHECREGLAEF